MRSRFERAVADSRLDHGEDDEAETVPALDFFDSIAASQARASPLVANVMLAGPA